MQISSAPAEERPALGILRAKIWRGRNLLPQIPVLRTGANLDSQIPLWRSVEGSRQPAPIGDRQRIVVSEIIEDRDRKLPEAVLPLG